jgi:hypothetical protein
MATTKGAIPPREVAPIPKAGADFQIVEREIPHPKEGLVRIRVQVCGVCHSGALTKDRWHDRLHHRAIGRGKTYGPSSGPRRRISNVGAQRAHRDNRDDHGTREIMRAQGTGSH